MNIGKCKLCLEENTELLNESHIIPDFFHDGLKNEKGRYSLILPDAYVKGRNQHLKNPFGAMYESDLLCKKCDNNIISGYETALRHILTQNRNTKYDFKYGDKNYRLYKDIDYTKFKLALLSILWRASIAKNKMFEQVNISPKHFENIRKMILNNDAKNVEDYPVLMYLFHENDEKLITNPRFLDEKPNQKAQFILNGYMLIFIIGTDSTFQTSLLVPNNSRELVLEIKEDNYLKNHMWNLIAITKEKLKKRS
ncbi:hypothetical protein K6T82_21240 [Flavobacterium sp. 17A]|uniref:HNH endonuclease n=1 Tax=Flavobacterium potami TaxID=2872310 RepID=A0A9X1KSA8_9FLAO|nr:hypothetical protein [Flavobacterium potami]MBZ4037299.1 hypothetical protein [Flavobacterium potami]